MLGVEGFPEAVSLVGPLPDPPMLVDVAEFFSEPFAAVESDTEDGVTAKVGVSMDSEWMGPCARISSAVPGL